MVITVCLASTHKATMYCQIFASQKKFSRIIYFYVFSDSCVASERIRDVQTFTSILCTEYECLDSNPRNHNGSTNHNLPPLIPSHGTTHKTTHINIPWIAWCMLLVRWCQHNETAFAVSQVARLKNKKSLLFQALDSLLDACFQGSQLHSQTSYLVLWYQVGWDKWLVISTPVERRRKHWYWFGIVDSDIFVYKLSQT